MIPVTRHEPDQLPVLIVKAMHLAIQRMEMYGVEHSVAMQAIDVAFELIEELFEHTPSFTLSRLGTQILFNKVPLAETYFTRRFVDDFEEFGIHSLTFHKRMTKSDFSNVLRFLVRIPGKKLDRLDIEAYLNDLRIACIEVDRIKYVAVTGEVDEQQEAQRVLADILARHRGILERVLKEEGIDEGEVVGLDQFFGPFAPESTEVDVVSILGKIIEKSGIAEKEDDVLSEADRELLELVENIKRHLSDEEKLELARRIEQLSTPILKKEDVTTELLEKEFVVKEISQADAIKELLSCCADEEWNDKMRMKFRESVLSFLGTSQPEKAEMLMKLLFDIYDVEQFSWFGDAIKTATEAVVGLEEERYSSLLLEKLLQEKAECSPEIPHYSLLNIALVVIASAFMLKRKYFDICCIIKEFERRITAKPDYATKLGANSFMKMLSSSENVQKLLISIRDDISISDVHLRQIIDKLIAEDLTDAIIHELGFQKPSFVSLATQLLAPHSFVAIVKIEQYILQIRSIPRNEKGLILEQQDLRRAANVFSLAIRLDKDLAFPLMVQASSDPDPRLRIHIFFLMMQYPPEMSAKYIFTIFLTADRGIRNQIIGEIASKPNPTRDFILRQIFLYYPDLRVEIISCLNETETEYAKNFILDVLDRWIIYAEPLSPEGREQLFVTAINALAPFTDEPEVRKALKEFRREWKSEGILKTSFWMLSQKKDEVMQKVDEVLAK